MWWTELTATMWRLLDERGEVIAFVLLMIEEAGVPPIIPGDLLMILMGVRAAQGKLTLGQALLELEAATVIGATILYWISRRGGRALVDRLGRYIGATPARLDHAAAALQQHGESGIALGRLVPGLCILTAVAAGALAFPYRRFLPALAVGSLVHLLVFVLLGYLAGPPALAYAERFHLPFELVASLLLFAVIAVWLVRSARPRVQPTQPTTISLHDRSVNGLLAGGLAAIQSTLLLNIIVNTLGLVSHAGETSLLWVTGLLGHDEQPFLAVFLSPTVLVVPALWGLAYGAWFERRLPGPPWLRGLQFAALPLTSALFLAFPLVGVGVLGFELRAGLVPLAGELIRHTAYGLALGVGFAAIRRSRGLPGSAPDFSESADARHTDSGPNATVSRTVERG
ncbi:MAG: DedA family protein [Chloroflexota bacterium]